MLRLLLLSASAIVILAGFSAPFAVEGATGYLLAVMLILIGSAALWYLERKTVSHLDKEGLLNDILNTNEGPD